MKSANVVRGVALCLQILICGAVMNGFSFWLGLLLLVSTLAVVASSQHIETLLDDRAKFLGVVAGSSRGAKP